MTTLKKNQKVDLELKPPPKKNRFCHSKNFPQEMGSVTFNL